MNSTHYLAVLCVLIKTVEIVRTRNDVVRFARIRIVGGTAYVWKTVTPLGRNNHQLSRVELFIMDVFSLIYCVATNVEFLTLMLQNIR